MSSPRHLATHRALLAAAAAITAAALSGCGEADQTATGGHGGMGMSPGTTSETSTTSATSTAPNPSDSPSSTASATSTATGSATPTSTAAGTPAAGAHNDADVAFASGMVPHHAQALVMADMALAHGRTEDFLALAKAIKAAQKPEIDQMSGWLVGWGQPVPGGTGHAGHGAGMMSQQELDDLSQMRGSGFEGMWLTMMVEHHEGAVAMSKTELEAGRNPEAKTLAQAIITAQNAEITQMRAMASERAN